MVIEANPEVFPQLQLFRSFQVMLSAWKIFPQNFQETEIHCLVSTEAPDFLFFFSVKWKLNQVI